MTEMVRGRLYALGVDPNGPTREGAGGGRVSARGRSGNAGDPVAMTRPLASIAGMLREEGPRPATVPGGTAAFGSARHRGHFHLHATEP